MANRVTTFISEAKSELKKVTWPSRNDVYASTVVVLAVTALLAVYIGIADSIISKLIALLIR